MLFRAFQIVGWCLVFAVVLIAVYFMGAASRTTGANPVIEYKDFVAILLTALGVMVAVAAVAAAFAAVWGFELLRKEMREVAGQIAKNEVQATVPGLVDEAMAFQREGRVVAGDRVAEEYERETENGGE